MAWNNNNNCTSNWSITNIRYCSFNCSIFTHRKAAYAANEYAIERIKEIVPIWKKEIWEDGAEWQGHQKGTYNEAKRESKMKILYFAELKELLNRSTETIHLDTTLTVQEFESYLLKHHSELKSKNFK